MTTVTAIADAAFDAVHAAITDVIKDATLSYATNYDHTYDVDEGNYSQATTSITGRVVFDTEKPAKDIFTDYVQGPKEELVLLEGFSAAAKEGYTLTIGSDNYVVRRAQAVAGSVSLVYAVVAKK
ncbi:MAG: hypothetical protein Unbinned4497contig1000_24 [Prokaryotic dsDNA virus sp.]|nr:MAG: hypothetical protein Unbinned4497contig1000_24 [Prokaryotic dsDNA virus sp.]|tara:strand:+ start:12756 stop:13130 length:375 start_codon:yes stop_codon:yes gene_type:complete